MLQKYDEPQSRRERACLTCMMNLDRQMRGVFKKRMSWTRQMMGAFKICYDMVNRNRYMQGRA